MRSRVTILSILLLLIAGGVALWRRGPDDPKARVQAAEPAPSAGQLSIVDKTGKTIGLCPLQHTSVKANISGFVARVTIDQKFQNPSREPIEALYTFPLPGDAAIDAMTMTIGTRVIKGEIKRREEARQIHEAAREAGQTAALLDQERPNIFTQSVANIMPGEDVAITISYVNLLKYDKGKYEFTYPMVVGPRFVPSGGYSEPGKRGDPSSRSEAGSNSDTGSDDTISNDYTISRGNTNAVVKDADKITPPIAPPKERAGHDIDVTVTLDSGVPLGEVTSQLHEVDVQRDGLRRATVALRDANTIPNKDFVLRYEVAGDALESAILTSPAEGGEGGYFTLILQPPVAPARTEIAPKEMIFVIDQTGSQMGWPIEKAKETMRYCIQNLNPDDTFQLIGFNTDVYPCFEKAVEASPSTIDKALKYLKPLEGGGGTDILKAADYALKLPNDPVRPRIVCFVTDGYVGNDMQIIDYIQKHRGEARMFPFGVGNSVNRFLIDGMAREGRGVAEYVYLNDKGEKAATSFYKRVADPFLLDVKVDWGGLDVEDVYPRQIPDVFSSGPIVLKGRFKGKGGGQVVVSGLLGGKPWTKSVPADFSSDAATEDSAIPAIWAREKIEDLQAQDWMGAQSGNAKAGIKEQIVATALEYRLMSQWTSFVAVEKRVVNVGGKQRLLDVPVEMPDGVSYSGIFGDGDEEAEFSSVKGAMSMAKMKSSNSTYYSGGTLGAVSLSAVVRQRSMAPASPALRGSRQFDSLVVGGAAATSLSASEQKIARGDTAALSSLAAQKPEERRATLIRAKLAASLQNLEALVKSEGANGTLRKKGVPEVDNNRVVVQIWLNAMPADALQQLEKLGFKLDATLIKDKLILGSIDVGKLDALTELTFVRRIEPPAIK